MKFVFSSSALKMEEAEEAIDGSIIAGSVEETIELAAGLKLYPNPAHNNVTLEFDGELEQAQINVFDIMGKQVFSDNLTKGSYMLNVDTFTPGIYLVVLQNGSKYYTQRLAVKRDL